MTTFAGTTVTETESLLSCLYGDAHEADIERGPSSAWAGTPTVASKEPSRLTIARSGGDQPGSIFTGEHDQFCPSTTIRLPRSAVLGAVSSASSVPDEVPKGTGSGVVFETPAEDEGTGLAVVVVVPELG
ncbi:hypothetical protein AB0M22_38645 [Nocardia sp. NPDC051756]|uniref:hypothetical protein n=1 Tax=Nocardia sp. NPDC051756 TaxID=3154751 RepID=UPI00342F02B2